MILLRAAARRSCVVSPTLLRARVCVPHAVRLASSTTSSPKATRVPIPSQSSIATTLASSSSSPSPSPSSSSSPTSAHSPLLNSSQSGSHQTPLPPNTPPQQQEDMPPRQGLLARLAADVSSHPRFSAHWWFDFAVIMTVFAVAGSSCVRVSSYILHSLLGLSGTFWHGPPLYSLTHFIVTFPVYSAILFTVGTIAGKGPYVRNVLRRMWARPLALFRR